MVIVRPMVTKTISHYEILAPIGEGGMGVVCRAVDTRLGRPVALKLLRHERLINTESRTRFIQEARAASALNHPHIITIYDIGQDQGIDFIAMEYVAGQSLPQAFSHQADVGHRLDRLSRDFSRWKDARVLVGSQRRRKSGHLGPAGSGWSTGEADQRRGRRSRTIVLGGRKQDSVPLESPRRRRLCRSDAGR
jgi:hypothetical protein